MSRYAQVPEGVLDLTPTQIKVYSACSLLRDFRTDLTDATVTQIAEVARVDHRACRRALQALEEIGWLTTVTAHTSRRAAVRKVEDELREGATVTSLGGHTSPLQRGFSYPPLHRDPEKDARPATADEPPPPAYPQEEHVPDDQPDLFAETPDLAPEPDAAKVHARQRRERPKTGAPLVVATYIEEYAKAHGRQPMMTVRGKIGREARSKLAHGVASEADLLEAVTRMAKTEYESLDTELSKLRQERHRANERTGAAAAQARHRAEGTQPASALSEAEIAAGHDEARARILAAMQQARPA